MPETRYRVQTFVVNGTKCDKADIGEGKFMKGKCFKKGKRMVGLWLLILSVVCMAGCGKEQVEDALADSLTDSSAEVEIKSTEQDGENQEEPVSEDISDPAAESSLESVGQEFITETPVVESVEAPPTEEEILEFLETGYAEMEHDKSLVMWEVVEATPYKILSGIEWKSQDESIVVVREGMIYALNPGKTLITAKIGTYDLFCAVEVTGYEGMKLAMNCSRSIGANDLADSLRLESENPEIVEVSGNLITAKGAGRCMITGYMGEESYQFDVTVTEPQISMTAFTKTVGVEEQLYVYGSPSEIIWKSDNEAIATVDQSGVVKGAPKGINQTTTIRAQVDGAELCCQVTVEAIPQLSTSYRIYGYSTDVDENGGVVENEIALYANTNEVSKPNNYNKDSLSQKESVLSMSSVRFDGYTFPLYYAYANEAVNQSTIAEGRCAHTQIYLLGTSRDARVMIKSGDGGEVSGGSVATYTPMDGFGIIDVYIDVVPFEMSGTYYPNSDSNISTDYGYSSIPKEQFQNGGTWYLNKGGAHKCQISYISMGDIETYEDYSGNTHIKRQFTGKAFDEKNAYFRVYVEIDGLEYKIYVNAWDLGVYDPSAPIPSKFYIDDENINGDMYSTETAQVSSASGQVQVAGSNTVFRSNSDSFISGEWVDKIKDKFVEEVENQAISWAVSTLFKIIFF